MAPRLMCNKMTGFEYRSYLMSTLYGSPANLLDPGFEYPIQGTGTSAYQYDPTGSAWTFSGTAGLAGNGSTFTSGNPNAPQGNQVAFVQRTGSISQVVSFAAAGSYLISFSAAQRGNNGTSNEEVQVQVDGTVVGTFTPAGTGYATYTTARSTWPPAATPSPSSASIPPGPTTPPCSIKSASSTRRRPGSLTPVSRARARGRPTSMIRRARRGLSSDRPDWRATAAA